MPQEELRITITPSQFANLLRKALTNNDVTIPRMSGEALKGRVVSLQFSMTDRVNNDASLIISAGEGSTMVSLVISKEEYDKQIYVSPFLKAERF